MCGTHKTTKSTVGKEYEGASVAGRREELWCVCEIGSH